MSDFFMVYVDGSSGPTVRRASLEDATKEAIRLADKTGKMAWVLSPTREIPARQLKQAIMEAIVIDEVMRMETHFTYDSLRFLLNRLLPDDDQKKDA